jgi:cation:H+ antiporter
MLLYYIILFFAGAALLYFGAEMLVKGSSRLALLLGIQPIIVGFTVVAMGTSSPELAVSLTAAIQNSKNIALGNIIGSNIANLALVIGAAALIQPITIKRNTARREMPFLIGTSIVFLLISLDGELSRGDGIILLILFAVFLWYVLYMALKKRRIRPDGEPDIPDGKKSSLINLVYSIAGVIMLVISSNLIIRSATFLATEFGISHIVIGMTVVALGTSLPELAVSSVSSFKNESDILVGNVVGSNLFNTLLIIALVAVLYPIPVEKEILSFHYPYMIGLTLLFLPMITIKKTISRIEGIFLLCLYAVFIYLLFFK